MVRNENMTLLTLVTHINKISSTNWGKPVKATMRDYPHTAFKIIEIDNQNDEVYVVLGDEIKNTREENGAKR